MSLISIYRNICTSIDYMSEGWFFGFRATLTNIRMNDIFNSSYTETKLPDLRHFIGQ